MRSRSTAHEQVAEVARRRLELLSAELAGIRHEDPAPGPSGSAGPGEPFSARAAASLDGPFPAEAPAGPGEGTDCAPHPADPPAASPAASPEVESRAGPSPSGRHARRPVGARARVGCWLLDHLPPTLHGRVQLGVSQLLVVGLLAGVAVVVAGWFLLRADGAGTPVPANGSARPGQGTPSALVSLSSPATSGTPPGRAVASPVPPAGAATGPAPPDAVIIVDVAGKVRRPGIATLPAGSRVVDALEAAGGVRHGVDTSTLNLARPLVDGEQVAVGLPTPAGVAASAASAPDATGTALVNLNTATESELETLPGVGPVTAAAILKWRTEHGSFTAVDQLLDVSGIGDATLAEIAPDVTL